MKLFKAHTPRANVVIRAFGVMVISCLWMVQAAQANDLLLSSATLTNIGARGIKVLTPHVSDQLAGRHE